METLNVNAFIFVAGSFPNAAIAFERLILERK